METNILPTENSSNCVINISFKRRLVDEEISNSKKFKTSNGEDTQSIHINDLPEDVLLIILSNLDCHGLRQFSQTCTLFSRLCSDFTLWRNVNFTYASANHDDMNYISSYVHKDTHKLNIRGPCSLNNTKSDLLTRKWLRVIVEKIRNLREFALPFHSFDCQIITISEFPSTLTKLDLSNTFLRGTLIGRSYFKDIVNLMPDLKILLLSNCSWFEPHSLMAISKCLKLEELRINDCTQVHDCLAYCGLSTRGGFKNLKTLDLRRCSISNSELICFTSVASLKNIYLEFTEESSITIDAAIAAMFFEKAPANWIGPDAPSNMLRIEKLVLRNYKLFRDDVFIKMVMRGGHLKYVDVTGCSVTKIAINSMLDTRPELKVVCEF